MSTPQAIIERVKTELEAADIEVRFVDGWKDRGRPRPFVPHGLVCHHTAMNRHREGDYPSLGMVTDGRFGPEEKDPLEGPLAQFGLGRSGRVYVIAAGNANHAGGGGFRGLSGNGSVWGIEAENDGLGEPWPPAQLDSYVRLAAALARHTGFGPEMIAAHREWTPDKIDPTGIEMDDFRAAVAKVIDHNGIRVRETEETDMFIFDGPDGGVFRTDGVTRWPIRSGQTATVLLDVGRVRHLGTLGHEAFSELLDGEASATSLRTELGQLRDQLQTMSEKVDGVMMSVAARP